MRLVVVPPDHPAAWSLRPWSKVKRLLCLVVGHRLEVGGWVPARLRCERCFQWFNDE